MKIELTIFTPHARKLLTAEVELREIAEEATNMIMADHKRKADYRDMKIILDFMDYTDRPLLSSSLQELVQGKHPDYRLWLKFGAPERADNFHNTIQSIADQYCAPGSEIVFLYEREENGDWQSSFYHAAYRALMDFGPYRFHWEANHVV